jgi:transposase
MSEAINGQALSKARRVMLKRHNGKHCPLAIRQQIVNALANGDSKRAIARGLRVSNNTVTAIAEQEWQQVETRKQRIVAQCERNATLAADQLAERLETEKLSANQLVPVFGVSVDKMLALTGQVPCVQIANVVLPTPAEQAERQAMFAKLDEITKRLAAP